ncbi:MAG: helix-turn-helix transcriptional regulator [bacterium]|nr:helix-turn-helix transcriptional regulator [bacterium]
MKEAIGVRFRKMREYAGLSQKETGRLFGMNQSNIARIEKGIVSPNMAICDYFHTHYNINMNWLITGEGEMALADEDNDKIPADYGEFSEEMKDLLFHLDHVPTARFAILKYFMGFKLENKKNILDFLKDNDITKE